MNEINRGRLVLAESGRSFTRLRCIRLTSLAAWLVFGLFWAAPALCERIAYDTPAWRKEIANGYLPYHRLVRADFRIDDRAQPKYAMYTFAFFHFNYQYVFSDQNGQVVARVTEWRVRSGFDRNRSWRKSWYKTVEKLLPHEQGHLDINELHSRRLAHMDLDNLPMGNGRDGGEAADDLKVKLKTLSTKVSKEDQAEQDAYDARTAHGTNQVRQVAATAELQRRLKEAGISYGNEPGNDQTEATPEAKAPLERLGGTLKRTH
jgi:hypothetical protein